MQDVPIDKLLDKTHSIYKLVILSAKRAIELAEGAQKLVDDPLTAKPAHVALDEILAGKVEYKIKEGK
jgi:DNA-directed RNA polymerase omega subunit